MPPKNKKMPRGKVHPAIYAEHLFRLGIFQEQTGGLFGVSPRTGQRWASDGVPIAVVMVLEECKTIRDLERWLNKKRVEKE